MAPTTRSQSKGTSKSHQPPRLSSKNRVRKTNASLPANSAANIKARLRSARKKINDDDIVISNIKSSNGTTRARDSAALRVFGVHELVESILLHLPARDVQAAARTNTFINNVVKQSTSLQKILCFVADAQAMVTRHVVRLGPPRPKAPLPTKMPKLNCLLAGDRGERLPFTFDEHRRGCLYYIYLMVGIHDNPYANYRDMFLTQPPVTSVTVDSHDQRNERLEENPAGIKTSDIFSHLARVEKKFGPLRDTVELRFGKPIAIDWRTDEEEDQQMERLRQAALPPKSSRLPSRIPRRYIG